MNFYGQKGMVIQVTEDKTHWEGVLDRGIVYIVIPERQKSVWPIHFEDFVGHKFNDFKNPVLIELEKDLGSTEPLPPFDIE